MNPKPPGAGKIAVMVAFSLSVVAIALFLWLSFGGTLPLQPEGYRVKVALPEAALLVQEADVRMAGVNIGKVKGKELSADGRRTVAELQIDPKFAPIARDTRAILRQKSLLGETYVELSPGHRPHAELPDGGTLARTQVDGTTELDEIFGAFDSRTRESFRAWLDQAGIASSGSYARDFNDSLGNLAPFARDGADLLRPLDEQEVALSRLVRGTGRVFDAVSAENGQLRGLIEHGQATFGALASRDDALAETFRIFPTFLRETRATVGRLETFARETDPLVADLRGPARDLGPTLRDLGALSPDLEQLFGDIQPLTDAARSGAPAAQHVLEGARPLLGAVHGFMPELNPILSYLAYSQQQIGQFLAIGGGALAGNGEGGYLGGNTSAEHYLPQAAVIDSRSLQRRTKRPSWDRGNAYVAPNTYPRAISLGSIESFDCKPAGGEQPDASGSGQTAAPPCFVAPKQLYQRQQYPRLERGKALAVPSPRGREGTERATP